MRINIIENKKLKDSNNKDITKKVFNFLKKVKSYDVQYFQLNYEVSKNSIYELKLIENITINAPLGYEGYIINKINFTIESKEG